MSAALLWMSLGAFAAPEPYLGGHASGLLLGPNNELYQPGAQQQQGNSLAAAFGVLGGVDLSRYFGIEAEADVGDWPLGGNAALLGAVRLHPKFVLPNLLGQGNNLLFTVGMGALMALSQDALGRDTDLAIHLGPGAEFALTETLRLRTDARVLISSRKGISPVPSYHGLLTVGVSWHPWSGPTVVKDLDGDGLPDDVDGCPSVAETRNGYLDDDGCADTLAELRVTLNDAAGAPVPGAEVWVGERGPELTGADGQAVFSGLMPGQSASPRVVFDHGAASSTPLDLAEGPNQASVGWRWNPGTIYVMAAGPDGKPVDAGVVAQSQGKNEARWTLGPTGDAYHELPPGDWELRATTEGLQVKVASLQIVPDDEALLRVSFALKKATVKVTATAFELEDSIQFESGSSKVLAASMPIIQEVANLLKAHPEVKRLQVEGHTDNRGNATTNQRLSQARVDQVVRLLVEAGISKDRLSAKGFGESKPIADNTTPEGRAKNRRVELRVESATKP